MERNTLHAHFPPCKKKTTDIDDTSTEENDERCEHFFSYAKPSKAKNCQKPIKHKNHS